MLQALVCYVAPFSYPEGVPVLWPALEPPPEQALAFFLEPVQAIFRPGEGGGNARGVRALRHPTREGVEVYLFPGQVGLLILRRNLELVAEPAALLRREASRKGETYRLSREILGELMEGTRPLIYDQRLLTWTLWPIPELSTQEEGKMLLALTEHQGAEAPDGLRPGTARALLRRQGLAHWKTWSGLFHRDNAAFVINPVGLKGRLPLRRMLEESHFRLYLLMLYLKLRLLNLMRLLIPDDPTRPLENLDSMWTLYDGLRTEYLQFLNGFWFAEVTRDTTGQAAYRKLRRAMGLRSLMGEVSEEIRILHSQYARLLAQQETRQREGLQDRVNVITFYLLPLTMTSGILGMNVIVPGSTVGLGTGLLWLAGVLGSILTMMALGLLVQRLRRRR